MRLVPKPWDALGIQGNVNHQQAAAASIIRIPAESCRPAHTLCTPMEGRREGRKENPRHAPHYAPWQRAIGTCTTIPTHLTTSNRASDSPVPALDPVPVFPADRIAFFTHALAVLPPGLVNTSLPYSNRPFPIQLLVQFIPHI